MVQIMRNPTQCVLWDKPERFKGPLKDQFERLETLVDESHWIRHILKCRECGQRYFYEFYEVIDWVDGEDPQYRTLVPFDTEEELEALRASNHMTLLEFSPRLQRDWPKGVDAPTVGWIA